MNTANREVHDVIVVGSGIAGLTAAGLLAAAGTSVLVVEQHDRPGGYVHGFRRRRYHFDSAVHLISGCASDGYPGAQVIDKTLNVLGVRGEIDFIRIDPFAVAVYPGIRTALPQTIDAFVQRMGALFPSQIEGLKKFIDLSLEVAREASSADEIMAHNRPARMRSGFSAWLKVRRSTLADVCSEFLQDPKLIAILTTNWPYLGLPPSRVSYLYWAAMFIGYLEDGACYCRGGFQRLADTLTNGLQRKGGAIRLKTAVDRIELRNGQVRGVVLDNGQKLSAPLVIANSDMRQTVHELIGAEHFPKRFMQRMANMKASLSIFVVYIATDLNLEEFGLDHESFQYSDFDHELNYLNSCAGKVTWIGISIPSLKDNTLAPAGQHLVLLTTLVPYQIDRSWKLAKTTYMTEMLALANQFIPGLKKRILYIEGGSPQTMQRYTRNYRGAAYGWEMSPDQSGPNRVPNRSPIKGLFFAGHWAAPGGGVYGAAVSGMQTAKAILGISEQSEFWKRFEWNGNFRGLNTEAKAASPH